MNIKYLVYFISTPEIKKPNDTVFVISIAECEIQALKICKDNLSEIANSLTLTNQFSIYTFDIAENPFEDYIKDIKKLQKTIKYVGTNDAFKGLADINTYLMILNRLINIIIEYKKVVVDKKNCVHVKRK